MNKVNKYQFKFFFFWTDKVQFRNKLLSLKESFKYICF